MSSKPKSPEKSLFSGSGFTQTEIDLAEDLLATQVDIEKSNKTTTEIQTQDQPIQFENVDEGLENARILMNEGLLDDAKRILHRIIVIEPRNLQAKRLLEDIHDLELKEIFLDAPKRRGVFRNSLLRSDSFETKLDTLEIIKKLDADLELNFLVEASKKPIYVVDEDLTPNDHIDIGIGFFEIGLMDSAIRHFQKALSESEDPYVPACLLAQTYIHEGKGFDATQILEPLLSQEDLTIEDKIEVYYLLGRSYALMNDYTRASQWFGEVIRINSDYRDSAERLMQLQNQ
jgi:tetratricopeptide (TPR) repeat protein